MNAILARLARRIDFCHRRFEETGEVRWLAAAQKADRMYLRAKAAA